MNILGIDFEDWYHPELIQRNITIKNPTPQVINGIDKILDWLRRNNTYATFFIVGELLQHKPELLDKIVTAGHEIAFHTMHHTNLITNGNKDEFLKELKIFDELTNKRSKGFRAPTFSLNSSNSWIIDCLVEANYHYDSSVVPAKTSMYGSPHAEQHPYKISSTSLEKNDPNGKLIEFPLLVTRLLGKKIPTGGFYVRMLPTKIIEKAISAYEKEGIPACFYIHSWELTPEFMPKISLPVKDRFVTFHNIEKAFPRMDRLLKFFKFTSFERFLSEKNFNYN